MQSVDPEGVRQLASKLLDACEGENPVVASAALSVAGWTAYQQSKRDPKHYIRMLGRIHGFHWVRKPEVMRSIRKTLWLLQM